jgi:hypothetical protein
MEVRIADLKERIQVEEDFLYRLEYSDDYCYSNGRYDAQQGVVRELKVNLAIFEGKNK